MDASYMGALGPGGGGLGVVAGGGGGCGVGGGGLCGGGTIGDSPVYPSSMGGLYSPHTPIGPGGTSLPPYYTQHGHLSQQHQQQQQAAGYHQYTADPRFQHSCILELRKEKSRDAARSRRGKENYEFYELAKLLPLPGAITSQLDKASIIRLTISYLKLRDFSSHGDPPWNRDGPPPNKSVKGGPPRRRSMAAVAMEIFETHQGSHILQSLDGFAFAMSNDGRFLYISETVSIYLGLSQVEMTGSSVFDYVHVADHSELADQLGLVLPGGGPGGSTGGGPGGTTGGSTLPSPASTSDDGSSSAPTPRAPSPPLPDRAIMNPNPSKGYDRTFCIRMKSTLTKRGVHVKCSGYRVVQILAHMRPQFSFSLTRKHPPPLLGLVGMAIALPPPTINELLIDNDMFVTRLSPEFKVIYCEPRIGDLMDVSADDLTNKNLYDYCHAEDLQHLRKAHVDLLGKGQVLTEYYRLMNKHGGFVWIQTCATIICNAKNAEDQNIIAINYVLSGIEYGGCVMDTNQLRIVSHSKPDQSDHSESETGSDKEGSKDDADRKSPARRERQDGRETPRGQKRKHAGGPDVEGISKDMVGVVGVDSASPDDHPLSLLYQSATATSGDDPTSAGLAALYAADDTKYHNGVTSGGGDKGKILDSKNSISRRKMDKPRKRKRESESEPETGSTDAVIDVDNDPNSIENLLNSAAGGSGGDSLHENGTNSRHSSVPPSPQDISHKLKSPAPEDLSVKTPQGAAATLQSPTSTGAPPGDTSGGTGNSTTTASDDWHTSPSSAPADPYGDMPTTTSTVRDLEDVMNKHLPALSSDADLRAGFHHSDYGTLGGYKQHKSTIQWIGSQHAHAHNPDHLPATQLLRTLYANRESVIRTNVYNPRPQYYGDVQGSLLTPPGGVGGAADTYKDTSPFSVPSQVNPSSAKTPPATYGGTGLMGSSSSYSSNPISVMSTNMAVSDSYSMTPPSSVSPQDKYASPFPGSTSDQCHTDAQYRQYADTSALPIKPHAYPLPAHVNPSAAYDRTPAAQYAGYYAQTGTFPGYAHASSPTPAHYRDATKNGNW